MCYTELTWTDPMAIMLITAYEHQIPDLGGECQSWLHLYIINWIFESWINSYKMYRTVQSVQLYISVVKAKKTNKIIVKLLSTFYCQHHKMPTILATDVRASRTSMSSLSWFSDALAHVLLPVRVDRGREQLRLLEVCSIVCVSLLQTIPSQLHAIPSKK